MSYRENQTISHQKRNQQFRSFITLRVNCSILALHIFKFFLLQIDIIHYNYITKCYSPIFPTKMREGGIKLKQSKV